MKTSTEWIVISMINLRSINTIYFEGEDAL